MSGNAAERTLEFHDFQHEVANLQFLHLVSESGGYQLLQMLLLWAQRLLTPLLLLWETHPLCGGEEREVSRGQGTGFLDLVGSEIWA